jgi:RES domain-containing protein
VGAEPALVPLSGTWFRHVRAGGDPLAAAQGDAQGRWQSARKVGALYLADSPQTAWAEFYRAIAELEVPPAQLLPRDLWRYRVALDEVADLSDPASLKAAGLTAAAPDSRDWPSFQAVGERLAVSGAEGVLYRSAARPAQLCLCVFAMAIAKVTPIDSERHDTAPVPPRGMRT